MSIAAGKNSFVVIDLYGEVWISGMNNLNQFGVKCLVEHDAHPCKLPQFGFFIDVKCTEKNLILLDKDGFVWKSIPQQSSVTTLQKKTKRVVETHFSKDIPINFLRISEIKSVKEIAAGDEHFMILDYKGRVWTAGSNIHSELGRGLKRKFNYSYELGMVTDIPIAKGVACGSSHSLILSVEGKVYGCGYNSALQINDSKCNDYIYEFEHIFTECIISIVEGGGLSSFFIDGTGIVWTRGYPYNNYLDFIKNIPPIKQVSANYESLIMLDTEGYVWVMGNNESCILGIEEKRIQNPTKLLYLPEIVKISLGNNYSLVVDINGNLWHCGISKNSEFLTIFQKHPESPLISIFNSSKKSARTLSK